MSPHRPRISANVRLLMAARAARSIGQGALVADFALYLRALGWSAATIGTVLTGTLAFNAVLTLLIGPLSDRLGRKGFLVAYEGLLSLAALAATLTSQPVILVIAALIGSFGRGANGAAGPFSPVEQAWLAQDVPPRERGRVYSINAAGGFFGMGLGAALAALPGLLQPWLPGALAYRPLFVIVLAGSLLCAGLILRAKDEARPTRVGKKTPREAAMAENLDNDTKIAAQVDGGAKITRAENRLLRRLMLANAVNGFGIGLAGPLMAYWFALRFGAGPEAIGPLMGTAFVLAGLSSLGTGRLTRRFGLVRSVIGMRIIGLVSLLALPLAPSLPIAALLYMVRSVFNRGTAGARQALSISLVRPERRGAAASISAVSLGLPRAIGPIFAGLLYDGGFLALPFLAAAGFQAAYLWIYYHSFRDHEPGAGGTAGPDTA